MTQILLTSFVTWTVGQTSNAADDLLLEILQNNPPPSLAFLRGLPVNLPVARDLTIAKIQQLQPQAIVLCGMAESRTRLSVESNGARGDRQIYTAFDLPTLTADLPMTDISANAGRFVCNSLYYALLSAAYPCVFVHVPVLTMGNRRAIVSDFRQILDRLIG
ncbi:MAG TPA: peptidase C15 [Coleofasciculaceae cyanobacterium]|jgi:pyroglutamyl-peptidase